MSSVTFPSPASIPDSGQRIDVVYSPDNRGWYVEVWDAATGADIWTSDVCFFREAAVREWLLWQATGAAERSDRLYTRERSGEAAS